MEDINTNTTSVITLSKINIEKAVITYLNLAKGKNSESRNNITFGKFTSTWETFFDTEEIAYRDSRDLKIQAFKNMHHLLDDKSIEEIKEYRETICLYTGSEVPLDIVEMAKNKNSNLKICFAKNRNINLSGFDVLLKYSNRENLRLNTVPYGLTEKSLRRFINSMPTKQEIVQNEKALMDILKDEKVSMKNRKKAVCKYKAPYATQEFRVFMNKFTIHKCKDTVLLNHCVALCQRVHIVNLSNNKPIKYAFCEGSGKRKASLQRAKRIRKKRQRKNTKSA